MIKTCPYHLLGCAVGFLSAQYDVSRGYSLVEMAFILQIRFTSLWNIILWRERWYQFMPFCGRLVHWGGTDGVLMEHLLLCLALIGAMAWYVHAP